MLKRYRAKQDYRLSVPVKIKGVTRFIAFGGGSVYLGLKGSYATSDKTLQDAIEASPLFNKKFVLEASMAQKETKPKDKKVKETKEVLHFSNFNELRDYLINEKGLAPVAVYSLERAERQMKKYGIDYTLEDEGL